MRKPFESNFTNEFILNINSLDTYKQNMTDISNTLTQMVNNLSSRLDNLEKENEQLRQTNDQLRRTNEQLVTYKVLKKQVLNHLLFVVNGVMSRKQATDPRTCKSN
jgi:hypothetical protein